LVQQWVRVLNYLFACFSVLYNPGNCNAMRKEL
jgi:hypothetical protein